VKFARWFFRRLEESPVGLGNLVKTGGFLRAERSGGLSGPANGVVCGKPAGGADGVTVAIAIPG